MEKLIRIWASANFDEGVGIRRDEYKVAPAPDWAIEKNIEDKCIWCEGSSISKTIFDKIRPVVCNDKMISFECYCDETTVDKFEAEIIEKIKIQGKAMVGIHQIRLDKSKKLLQEIEAFGKTERQFEIWSEGFMATGGGGGATLHGTAIGNSFQDACNKFAKNNSDFEKYFNADHMSFWGCKLFDNRHEAQKSFG